MHVCIYMHIYIYVEVCVCIMVALPQLIIQNRNSIYVASWDQQNVDEFDLCTEYGFRLFLVLSSVCNLNPR